MLGRTISHYEILEKLGEGGMGVVYKARDTRLDRFVAIKVLPPEKVTDPERRRRFTQEAKAASALNHPNIITIHDIEEADSVHFISMEFVAGKTLNALIPRHGMRLGEVLKYAIQIADALAKAHAAGIIHRDLKPGNIMVTDQGLVKVLDFGLAKLAETGLTSEHDATRTIKAATEEGKIVGTVAYMSPEQAEGKVVDARSDIFSFGAVLYEMTTGQRAFLGNSKISTLAAILHSEPTPAAALHPGLPQELEKIIQRCLRKDPAWRLQSAADLKISLHDLQVELESGVHAAATVAPQPAGWRALWPAMSIVAVALAAAGGWWFGSRVRPAIPGPVKPLTTYRGYQGEPALSPDGNQIAFSWDGEKGDNVDIYVRLVDGGSALRLTTDPAPDHGPAWSPDSRRLAFVRGDAIYIVPALGGVERKLVQFPKGRIAALNSLSSPRLSWSPDGKLLAFTGAESSGSSVVWLVSTEGGEPRRVTNPMPGTVGGGSDDAFAGFSPDGSKLALIRAHDLYSRGVLIQNMAGGSPSGDAREITGYERPIVEIEWAADGRSLIAAVRLASRSSLWRLELNGTLTPLGVGGEDAAWPSVSRTGNRLAYARRQNNSNIYRMDGPGPNGGPQSYQRCHVTRVIDSTAMEVEPMLSPDGRRLLFNSDRWGATEIHVADRDGSHQVALTSMGPTSVGSPRWSPDGSTVAFDRYEHGHSAIYTIAAEGGKPRRMTGEETSDIRPSFSRDGKWIYFTSARSGQSEVWKMPAGGGPAQQVTHSGLGSEAFESPDGRELYYCRADGLWAMPVAGGEPRLVLPEVTAPRYALAGRSIYYWSLNLEAIWVYRLDSGRKFEYVRFPPGSPPTLNAGTNLTVSADERVILFPVVVRQESNLMLVENFR
jgi:Tol biopolymer transport system component/predicted Ser/Thr protein kinase